MRVVRPARLEFGLRTRAQAWIFLASLILAGSTLIYFGGKTATAETLANSQNIEWVERAVKLDPSNPAPHYRLGALRLFSWEKPDSFAAMQHLSRAVELSPNNGPYWLALAAAAESVGDAPSAHDAIQHALDRRPMSPDYWWRAANFYLRAGQYESAWEHFRRVLQLSPSHADLVFRLCYKASSDPRVVAEKVLPPDASAALRLAYVDFLTSHRDYEGAFNVWQQIASKGLQTKVTFPSAQPYIDRLIADNRPEDAMSAWDDLLKWRVILRPASVNPSDAVFNGAFEQAPLNGGFDWRTTPLPYVVTDLQSAGPLRGTKSARVDFTVKHNEEYDILFQFVPIQPRRAYRVQAMVRSEGITSDSGPRLRVVDAASPARLEASTAPVIGTTDWHPIELTFSTGSDTRLVRLTVWRARSRTFPMEISGRFWIGAVSMIASGSPAELASAGPTRMP